MWCANLRIAIVVFQANPSNDRFYFRVINMTIIPGEEIINPVHACHGNRASGTLGQAGRW
jgi:hypothetical protein